MHLSPSITLDRVLYAPPRGFPVNLLSISRLTRTYTALLHSSLPIVSFGIFGQEQRLGEVLAWLYYLDGSFLSAPTASAVISAPSLSPLSP